MHQTQIKELFSKIRMWKSGGQRAPNKPLLLLYTLAGISRDEPRLKKYSEIEEDLRQLLNEFGPPRKNHRPNYPFVRLCNDGIWELKGKNSLDTRYDYSDKELIENSTYGGFTEEVYSLLKREPKLVSDLSNFLLHENFPETIHNDILDTIGFDTGHILTTRRPRNPDFRNRVLKAYEYSCAVCGFNVRLGNNLVAVEAAHIKWHQAGGPDSEENGIALCSMHHKLFDSGGIYSHRLHEDDCI